MSKESNAHKISRSVAEKLPKLEKSINGRGVDHIRELRKQSLEQLSSHGLPARKSEDYKYTYLSDAFTSEMINEIDNQVAIKEMHLPSFADDYNIAVFINGHFQADRSEIRDPDLVVEDLENGNEDEILKLTGTLSDKMKDPFATLNGSLLQNGFRITVAENKTVERPLLLHFVTDGQDATLAQPRGLIHLGRNSELNVIETYQTDANSAISNIVVEGFLEESARCNYYKIQDEGADATRIDNTFFSQKKNSLLNVFTFTFGGKVVRNNLNLALDSDNCESHMYGLYVVSGKTHVDNHTVVDHKMPDCFSNELYKGIMDEKATGVFNGKIFVRQDAQRTNAFQSNKNILLSDDATINTKPQLEIWADDVKCSHGCTNGQLDEEQLFYIRSRGIGEQYARKILLHAFAADVLTHVKIDEIKAFLDGKIMEKLD